MNAPCSLPSSATVPAKGASSRCSIFIASSTAISSPSATCWPTLTARERMTPGIGAIRRPSPLPATAVQSGDCGTGKRADEAVPRRQAPANAPRGAWRTESGGWSSRKAVVAVPARTSGWRTSQRRNGRLVITPATRAASSAAVRRSRASSRVAPCAISLAIIGS